MIRRTTCTLYKFEEEGEKNKRSVTPVFLSVGLKMQISSLSAANVQTVWADRNAACWHLLLAAGFCHMMVEK